MSLRNLQTLLKRTLIYQNTKYTANARCSSRWTHRNPAKVLLPFDSPPKTSLKTEKVIELDKKLTKNSQSQQQSENAGNKQSELQHNKSHSSQSSEKFKDIKVLKDEKLKKRNFYLSQKKVFDDNNEVIYEKLKEKDGRISSLMVKLKSKKDRLRTGQILVEGWRLIVDGLEAKCPLRYLIFSRTEDLNNLRPFLPKTGVQVYKISYKELEMWSNVETSPGIIGIFDLPTVDNIKVLSKPIPLRFICDNIRIPGNLGAILRAAVGVGCEKVLLTTGCVDVWDPKVVRSAAGAHFRLPIHHSIDWADMPMYLEQDTSIFVADSNAYVIEDDSETMEQKFTGLQIPVVPYYSIEYAPLSNITLIIGGETEGISEDSYRLAASHNGLRLNIPLQRGVDSLNTGMATAVIAFEIKKQILLARTGVKKERQLQQAV